MPTQPYFNAKGTRLPGVTTVLSVNLGWNKDALKFWANREGLAGREIRRDWGGSTMTRAADIGTTVHTMIEAHLLGQCPKLVAADLLTLLSCDEDREKAKRGFGNFMRWHRGTTIRVVATEVFGVDEAYQTGFCLDALALEDGEDGTPELTLLDWKSSKGTYADHVIQVAAYMHFIEEKLRLWGIPVRLTGAHIIRVGKDTGTFKHVFWDRATLEPAWKAFTWLRALHELKRPLEALAG